MIQKLLRTIIIAAVFLMPVLLWLTKKEYLPSISSFAFEENNIYYYIMYVLASWLFISRAYTHKRTLDYFVGLSMGALLIFDMYRFPLIHDISALVMFGAALFSMVYYSNSRRRMSNIILVFVASAFVVLGLTKVIHLFLAEMIAMLCIGVHMILRINIKKFVG